MFSESDIARVRDTVFHVTGLPFDGEVKVESGEKLSVLMQSGKAAIQAPDINALARGFFLLSRSVKEGKETLSVCQTRSFDTCGAMLDMSRGGVMTVEAVKRFIDMEASLGMNMLMLYTEDTYEVPEYPYMGYLRGRYSKAELREIDDYADSLGVELIPCIQTLGHMGQFLQWNNSEPLRDQKDVLLAGEEATYDFIEAEIRAVRSCMRARRIHIGMDEAHGVALGKYLEKHGLRDRFQVLNEHLSRVVDICRRYDFRPMMWSDMFFRLGSTKDINVNYDEDAVIPQEAIDAIPDVDLVYWDYYQTDRQVYDKILTQHERMRENTIFAGGIWVWSGFLPQVKRTDATMVPALKECAKHNVKTVFATMWGDDGTETDYFLAASQLPLFSEFCWQGPDVRMDEMILAGECLTGLPRAAYDAMGDFYPSEKDIRTGKGLIWCDLLYPLLDTEWDSMDDAMARAKNALNVLRPLCQRSDCRYASLLFEIVLEKAQLVRDLRSQYQARNMEYLNQAAQKTIPHLLSLYDALMRAHREQWEADKKRFGWEEMSMRYGAVTGRLRDVQDILSRFAGGTVACIPELEEEPLPPKRTWAQFYRGYTNPSANFI